MNKKLKMLVGCLGFMVLASGVARAEVVEYNRILGAMNDLAKNNPGLVETFEFGKNDQNEVITGLKIQDLSHGTIPNLLVGTHHGNERLSADLSVEYAKRLVEILKGPDTPAKQVLQNKIFYVVPVLNINGFNANSRYEKNVQGQAIDPNRDYPDICDTQKPTFQLKSIKLLSEFVRDKQIVAAVTVHGYVGTFTYPWGYYTDNYNTLDSEFYQKAGSQAVQANGYRTGTHGDLIYPASGTFEDWTYYTFGTWTMLVEMDRSATIKNDVTMLVSYFTTMPDFRSAKNQITGKCSQRLDTQQARLEEMLGRP